MPIVKVTDLAYARLQSPSLDDAERFLTDFGMVKTERTRDALYMRGTDAPHHIHVTHLGPSKFIGLAFSVATEDELRRNRCAEDKREQQRRNAAEEPLVLKAEHDQSPRSEAAILSFRASPATRA